MRAHLPSYDIRAAGSLDAALAALAEDPELKPIAGGTDLMVLLEAGKLAKGRYLSIWGLEELCGVEVEDDAVTVGALTTYRQVIRHPIFRAEYPMLVEAARLSGAAAIQNRGTLGGNIVNASPAADSPPALLCYDAELELVSASGTRRVAYDGFHSGYKQMDLQPGELVRAIRLPRKPGGEGAWHHYRKVGTRKAQAISKIVFAGLGRVEDGEVVHARIALGSVAPMTVRAKQAEQRLLGSDPSDPDVQVAVGVAAQDEVSPINDVRSTAHYRGAVTARVTAEFVRCLSVS